MTKLFRKAEAHITVHQLTHSHKSADVQSRLQHIAECGSEKTISALSAHKHIPRTRLGQSGGEMVKCTVATLLQD